jgi:anti-sigma28 factor (negative regulator of flagellin synthesis)
MRVNDPNTSASIGGLGGTKETQPGIQGRSAPASEAPRGDSEDRVQLSQLSAALRAADVESPERTAFLERLSAKVASGEYHVDSLELSRKLIRDALGE